MKYSALLIGTFAFISLPAVAATPYDGWDADNNTELTKDEFFGGWSDVGIYSDWSADDDVVDVDEFNDNVFATWDLDQDGYITEGEWDTGVDYWYDDYEGDFTEWDADGDGWVSADEFNITFDDTGIYEDWDLNDDGALDDEEFGTGIYGLWDYDNDGVVSEYDYTYDKYYWGVIG